MTAPRTRLVHRVPLRLRHHWKPAGVLAAGLSVLLVFFGDVRVTPFVTSASTADGDEITEDVTGAVDLFDDSRTHAIQLEYSQTDFDDMMSKFQDDGEKEYIKADLTVDGVYLNDVGIRLKGNSTLMSLRGGGGGRGGQPRGGGPRGGEQGGGGGGGMAQFDLSADKPEELPLLISIDEYVEGRAYEGHRELSLRPGTDEALPLNEALSLSLMKKSGQTAEKYAFTSVEVNNRPAATRLMVENPSKDYVDSELGTTGVAYKARAGSSFDYAGDDPTDYEESFKQLNLKGSQDLSPVMRLLKWVNKASDKDFAENLDQYVDVDSFSEYVATQNLILNFDDMAGPGKNYVLWYDLGTKKFSVLGWDFNLTFSGTATTGPDDSTSMGGGGAGAGARAGGGGGPAAPADGQQGAPPGVPQGARPGGNTAEAGGPGGGGGGGMGGNLLKERFLETAAFDDAYHAAYKQLYQEFYASGYAVDTLASLTTRAKQAGADASGVSTTAKSLKNTLTSRTESLAKNKVVTD
ncbi:CotH kinase family protein [Streptomyces sp. CWNU-52B]|uniref:CotH kinase family protein n=1 Tax=unclassified Streptomyces TaxID=2593676 RepID=UPI0039C1D407